MKNKKVLKISLLIITILCLAVGCKHFGEQSEQPPSNQQNNPPQVEIDTTSFDYWFPLVKEWNGTPYAVVNDNIPFFTNDEKIIITAFEIYTPLDNLGRCGIAYANICLDIMPTENRGSISNIKPTGWQSVKYDCIPGKWLYNRSHLIGFQLAGENDNKLNLITGTKYLNNYGMLPFENMVADFVKETEWHVLYRVTPIFLDNELVARGVLIEAWSVEDNGDGICFNVYCYNVQPGVIIDYATGLSEEE